MSSPKMFISSTYADLRDVRSSVADLVSSIGYTPISFERDDVAFDPNFSIEESCYDEISTCSMFILIIKNKFGAISQSKSKLPKSVTQMEYETAESLGIPILAFVYKSSMEEYYSYIKSGRNSSFDFRYLENLNHVKFIDELLSQKANRFIHQFTDVSDIKRKLKRQWAGLFNKYLINAQKFALRQGKEVLVNPYRLFYTRRTIGISQQDLAEKSGVPYDKIRASEDAGLKPGPRDSSQFETLTMIQMQSIADVLQCTVSDIKGGLPYDLLSQFLNFYYKYKGPVRFSKNRNSESRSIFKTKAVVFDFDGTLTMPNGNLTTWEDIWIYLDYDINECAELHTRFSRSEITHKKWCDLTESRFKRQKLHKDQLDVIADNIQLLAGTKEVIHNLSDSGVDLFICSGSIDYIINRVLGPLKHKFLEIKSNRFLFNREGYLNEIKGTRYDFEGKANYINQIAKEYFYEPHEILFVGNSLNDEWAFESGATTLCINPSMTNPTRSYQWIYSMRNVKDLNAIMEYVHI